MSCTDKKKQRCPKVYANCVSYESEVNTDSALKNENCLTIEETTQDIYNQLGKIATVTDLSNLGNNCLTYPKVDNKYQLKDVLKKFEEKLCDLDTTDPSKECININSDITSWGLNLECLEDACGEQITTFKGLLQAIITKIC